LQQRLATSSTQVASAPSIGHWVSWRDASPVKQVIQEGSILDVLANYTPVKSYYKLVKKIEDDPEFDVR
jgi:hypothetical protein